MKLGKLLVAVVALMSLPGCWDSESYRYKLTLSVNTPSGIKTASRVVEVTTRQGPRIGGGSGVGGSCKGEALYLDLGAGYPPLIALLGYRHYSPLKGRADAKNANVWAGCHPTNLLARVGGITDHDSARMQAMDLVRRLSGLPWPQELTSDQLPDLVALDDVRNPRTLMLVNPFKLHETLGSGVKWERITIGLTREPVSTGILKQLPWLGDSKTVIRSQINVGRSDFIEN